MFGSELIARPDCCRGGKRVEVFQIEQASRGFVMIAAHKNLSQVAGAIDDFVGRSSIAHNVAQVSYQIERWSCRQAGLQRFEVGVNVAKQQYAQGTPDGWRL